MRKILLTGALLMGLATAGAIAPTSAQATPLSGAAISSAIDNTSLAQEVAYYCRRVWRCGPWGCGWRRFCGWTPGYSYYGYGGPYAYYGGWGWRHRHRW